MATFTNTLPVLQNVINHLFLPPRLPNTADNVPLHGELLSRVLSALQAFKSFFAGDDEKALCLIEECLQSLSECLNTTGGLVEEKVLEMLKGLKQTGKNHSL